MGNFANTLFSVLLGWAQRVASGLWTLITSGGNGGLGAWVLDHWLLLVILLCAVGVLVDWAVYLLRWQPYRVWKGFLHRFGAETEDQEDGGEESWQWVNADGSVAPDPMVYPEVQADGMQLEAPVRPARRVIPAKRHGGQEPDGTGSGVPKAYHQPYYPPQWNAAQSGDGLTDEMQTMDGGNAP